MAFTLTDSNFKQEVLEKKGIALVDFWAEWCGPCKMIGPVVEELSKEYDGKALIAKVDVMKTQNSPPSTVYVIFLPS